MIDHPAPARMNGPAAMPTLDEAAAALRELAQLRDRFGPHDERLSLLLGASLHALADRFGDDGSCGSRSARSAA